MENKPQLLICPHCNKEFKKLGKLNRHVKEIHLNLRSFKCQKCMKEFKRNSHLKRHEAMHSDNPKPFSCKVDDCIQKFSNKYHLERHIKIIHTQNKIICEKCNNCVFTKKILLLKHNSEIHGAPYPFKCEINSCNRGFYKLGQYEMHKKEHDINQRIKQNLEAKIASNDLVKNNGSDENDELDNKTSGTPKTDCSDKSKKKNKKKHSKVNAFICFYDDCMKAYTTRHNLKTHIRSYHLNLKTYKCKFPECGIEFKHNSSLKNHNIKVHSIMMMDTNDIKIEPILNL